MKNLILAASLAVSFGATTAADAAAGSVSPAYSAQSSQRQAAVGDDSTCKSGCWASRQDEPVTVV